MYYNNDTIIYLDGQWVSPEKAGSNLYNQTMHYGLGVFEGIRSYDTEVGVSIFKAREHYERLVWSARQMKIPFDYSVEQLIDINYELLERNHFANAYIRPLVYMDPCMSLTPGKKSNFAMMAWVWDKFLGDQLIKVTISPYRRPDPRSCVVEAKVSGHYVNSILASVEARERGYDEALLLDVNGYVAEGPGANFFFENGGILFTSPPGNILPGITRATIMDLANELGIPVKEKFFTPDEVKGADAAFFVGTATEVCGIESLDDIPFAKAWPATSGYRLSKAYQQLIHKKQYVPQTALTYGA
ncbi:MAG: branched-chain-amino-acid transaminase [Bacteroidota bacterium]